MSRLYVVTVSSEKGGVGKTTLATNLAIYLKALCEDLPVTLCSFDNHFSVDRMFRISRGPTRGDVRDLLTGRPAEELVEIGEYGVQFIASSRELPALRDQVADPSSLARALAASQLEGVLIIDTRPDLDVFTQNALYAADRVIVPVKDAPSLENCRHLYDFFGTHNLPKKALRILPCLVDSRIRYEGPFRDPYQLLKSYAINRAYRCLEGFIAKSPKVESLNTNPEGKIYPILTHGRGTEVHLQFAHLARQVFLDLRDCDDLRLDAVRLDQARLSTLRTDAFSERQAALRSTCLVCGRTLVNETGIAPAGYYAETGSKSVAGFLEEECFSGLVFRNIYQSRREVLPGDPLRDLFRESAQRSFFVLRRAPNTKNFYQQQISFYRFDEDGLEISHKILDLTEFSGRLLNKERTELFRLAEAGLVDESGRLGDDFLLVRRISSDFPEEILYDEHYAAFRTVADRISAQFY